MAAPLTLTLLTEPGTSSQTFDASTKVTIGRTRGNKLIIKDSAVSSKHAVISWREADWVLTDLGSSNGTSINGSDRKIDEGAEHVLQDGEVVWLGPVRCPDERKTAHASFRKPSPLCGAQAP